MIMDVVWDDELGWYQVIESNGKNRYTKIQR